MKYPILTASFCLLMLGLGFFSGCDDYILPEGLQKLQISKTPPPSDNITIFNATASGNWLLLEVGYSGGCQEHEFALYWNGAWNKTNPPSADLTLVHNSNGDLCEAYLTHKLAFQIETVKYPNTDKVILNLPGYNKPITYLIQ